MADQTIAPEQITAAMRPPQLDGAIVYSLRAIADSDESATAYLLSPKEASAILMQFSKLVRHVNDVQAIVRSSEAR